MIKKKRRLRTIVLNSLAVFFGLLLTFFLVSEATAAWVLAEHAYVRTAFAKRIDVDGLDVFYRESGEEHSDTVVFIHGWLGSSYDFIQVMDALDEDYHVLALDLIGFGLSEKSLTFDYAKENQAAMVGHFLTELNITGATVISHSMGGEIAFHLAHDFPTLVSNMIMVSPGGYVEEGQTAGPSSSSPSFFYDLVLNNYYLQRLFFFTAYSQYEVDHQLATYDMFDEMYAVNKTIPGDVMVQWVVDNDSGAVMSKLASIEQPITMIWGENDGFIPFSTAAKLQSALTASSEVTIFPMANAGHLPFDTFFETFMIEVRNAL